MQNVNNSAPLPAWNVQPMLFRNYYATLGHGVLVLASRKKEMYYQNQFPCPHHDVHCKKLHRDSCEHPRCFSKERSHRTKLFPQFQPRHLLMSKSPVCGINNRRPIPSLRESRHSLDQLTMLIQSNLSLCCFPEHVRKKLGSGSSRHLRSGVQGLVQEGSNPRTRSQDHSIAWEEREARQCREDVGRHRLSPAASSAVTR
mmetsp:Transcript_1248/g.2400  ORF Transcript_1248/g.2400 Transcript_1248/m.2400 type:complete len:200 (+) Transcript_1248:150-749(+)